MNNCHSIINSMNIRFNTFKTVVIIAITTLALFTSCSEDASLCSEAEVTNFKLNLGNGNYKVGTIEDGNIIKFKVTPDFDITKLNGATSEFFISSYATVTPYPSEPQDFSKDVVYTVKAQDGTTSTWTVKWGYGDKLPDGEGFGYSLKKWEKSWTDLGFTADVENSLAVCGDYLVASRSCICLDKLTGENSGKKLNTTGIPSADGSSAKAVPFFLTNDSKGNLIGFTLPGWAGVFNIYKWSSIDSAPVLLYSTTSVGVSRKVNVVGDINGDAYIYDMRQGSVTGEHNRWKVTNGKVEAPEIFETSVPTNDGNWTQCMAALDASASPAFYLADPIAGGSNVWYFENGVNEQIQGPGTEGDKGPKGWGNFTQASCNTFKFNGKTYGAFLTSSWGKSFFTILSTNEAQEVVLNEIISPVQYNGNATGSICTSLSQDGESIYVYELLTSTGVRCYELTKYEK